MKGKTELLERFLGSQHLELACSLHRGLCGVRVVSYLSQGYAGVGSVLDKLLPERPIPCSCLPCVCARGLYDRA